MVRFLLGQRAIEDPETYQVPSSLGEPGKAPKVL